MSESAKDADTVLHEAEFRRCMVMMNGQAVDGYIAEFNGITGKGLTPKQAAAHIGKKMEAAA